MQAFKQLDGLVVPVDRANVDTDALIPKQFMKSIKRTGFGPNLFDEWRYLDPGEPGKDCTVRPLNEDFSLNKPRFQGASILLGRDNFGCGSSREHAPWALMDYGIRVLVCPSFADIFYVNCMKNGLLPVVLNSQVVDGLFQEVDRRPGYRLKVDLLAQTLTTPEGEQHRFDIDQFAKHCLLNGLDEVQLTLLESAKITDYEVRRRALEPWLFD